MKIRMLLDAPRNVIRRILVRAQEKGITAGLVTAEYAVGLIAACGFAGLLVAIMKSAEMRTLLFGIIRKALSV